MAAWERSTAYHSLLTFINTISQAIEGLSCTDRSVQRSPAIASLLDILGRIEALVDATPPIEQPQRFGNQAFRQLYAAIREQRVQLLETELLSSDALRPAAGECAEYLAESFGNAVRIDYGTGHELAFVMFLCCLFKLGALAEADLRATGLVVFPAYLRLVRKMHQTYNMEPAGSHGVWSLDDYQFVPFIWGAAQLAGPRAPLRPAQFLEPAVIAEHAEAYMFVGCIEYIGRVKRGAFAEHSPQLWNISAVESWAKICAGLVKMYQKELLAKWPVIQHVLFGSLMELRAVPAGTMLAAAPRLGMRAPAAVRAPAPVAAAAAEAGPKV